MNKRLFLTISCFGVVFSLASLALVGSQKPIEQQSILAAPEMTSRRVFVELDNTDGWSSGVHAWIFSSSTAKQMNSVCEISTNIYLYYLDLSVTEISGGFLFVDSSDMGASTPNWSGNKYQSKDIAADSFPTWGSADVCKVDTDPSNKASVSFGTSSLSESNLATLLTGYTSCMVDASGYTNSCLSYPQLVADFGIESCLGSTQAVAVSSGGEKNGTTLGEKIAMLKSQYQNYDTLEDEFSIILHCPKDYTHVWAWYYDDSLAEHNVFASSWPGEAMDTSNANWNTYTFNGYLSLNVIFSNNGNDQTANLSVFGAGDHYYLDGVWYTENPYKTRLYAPSEWTYGYAWDDSDNPLTSSFPGVVLQTYNENWKYFEIEDNEKVNFLFDNGEGQAQTADLSVNGYGDYYYYDGVILDNIDMVSESVNILHCFNWQLSDIEDNLAQIKAAGFDAVQTSPLQVPKDYSSSDTTDSDTWWKMYQPLSFYVPDSNTYIGNTSDLTSLTSAAEKIGMGVIVDVVANHMAANGNDQWTVNQGLPSFESELYSNRASTFRDNSLSVGSCST